MESIPRRPFLLQECGERIQDSVERDPPGKHGGALPGIVSE